MSPDNGSSMKRDILEKVQSFGTLLTSWFLVGTSSSFYLISLFVQHRMVPRENSS